MNALLRLEVVNCGVCACDHPKEAWGFPVMFRMDPLNDLEPYTAPIYIAGGCVYQL